MRYSLAALALAGLSYAAPQAAKAPTSQPAASCQKTIPGSFFISVVNVTRKRDALEERQNGALAITLNNGVLKDSQGRTGEIVANRQFQFDTVIQSGAVYTSGWAVCSNGSLVLGNQAVFYQCLSGNFYNLYDQTQGNQCGPIYIQTSATNGAVSSGTAAQRPDGQVTGSGVQSSTRPVSQISDGQLQATTRPVSQISDGQLQASTSGRVVSQISDGQIQASTSGRAVTQIADGQIQATTARPTSTGRVVSQISDGQIQATTGRVVSQISDGQIQATTARASSTGRPVSQISDGQIQAANATRTGAPATYTGGASTFRGELFGLAAGVVAVAML